MKALRLGLLAATLAVSLSAFAQYPGMGQGPFGQGPFGGGPFGRGRMGGRIGQRERDRQPPSVDDQTKKLKKELKLTDDQQKQVHGILEDQQKQMQQLRQDSSTSWQDKRSKFIEIHQATSSKIRDLLNDGQKKKYDKYEQKQQQQWQQRRSRTTGGGDF